MDKTSEAELIIAYIQTIREIDRGCRVEFDDYKKLKEKELLELNGENIQYYKKYLKWYNKATKQLDNIKKLEKTIGDNNIYQGLLREDKKQLINLGEEVIKENNKLKISIANSEPSRPKLTTVNIPDESLPGYKKPDNSRGQRDQFIVQPPPYSNNGDEKDTQKKAKERKSINLWQQMQLNKNRKKEQLRTAAQKRKADKLQKVREEKH